MSDLIKQLSEKARDSVPHGMLSPDFWIECYNEKFAELIIRECVHSVTRNESLNILERFDIDPKQFFGADK